LAGINIVVDYEKKEYKLLLGLSVLEFPKDDVKVNVYLSSLDGYFRSVYLVWCVFSDLIKHICLS